MTLIETKVWADEARHADAMSPRSTAAAEGFEGLAAAWTDVAARFLDRPTRPRSWMPDLCRALAEVTPPWQDLAPVSTRERQHQRVLLGPDFDAWLLAWPQDGSTELHDHGGASGSFVVIAGELLEVAGHRSTPVERTWAPGGPTASFGATYLHDMVNLRPELATSVHVYRPAITSMTYYERRGEAVRPVRVERVSDPALRIVGRAA